MADGKQDKRDVGYSTGGKDHCGVCEHYEPIHKGVGSCTKVEGMIRPWMWCRLFERAK